MTMKVKIKKSYNFKTSIKKKELKEYGVTWDIDTLNQIGEFFQSSVVSWWLVDPNVLWFSDGRKLLILTSAQCMKRMHAGDPGFKVQKMEPMNFNDFWYCKLD